MGQQRQKYSDKIA